MKEIRLNDAQPNTELEFQLPEKSQVELFLHNIGHSRTMRLAKVMMYKGLRKIHIQSDQLQKGIYVYVLKANQQQMDFGRIIVS